MHLGAIGLAVLVPLVFLLTFIARRIHAPGAGSLGDRLKTGFLKFRRGSGFLLTLCALLAADALAHWLVGFDPDFAITNVCLSVEASVATCLLLDMSLKQSEADRELMRAMMALLTKEEGEVEAIFARMENFK